MRLNWYSSMKFFFRKIRMIFDIENSLWKYKIGPFWWAVSPNGDSKFGNFIWLQLILGQKPCFLGPIQLVTQKLNNHYPKCHTTYLLHNEAKLLSKIAYDYPLWNIPKNNKAKTESNRNCHDMTGNVRNCQEFVTKTKFLLTHSPH